MKYKNTGVHIIYTLTGKNKRHIQKGYAHKNTDTHASTRYTSNHTLHTHPYDTHTKHRYN